MLNAHASTLQERMFGIPLSEVPFEDSLIVSIPPCSPSPNRPLGLTQDNPIPIQFRVKPAPTSPNAAVPLHPTSPPRRFEVSLVSLVQPAPDSKIWAYTPFTAPSIPQQQRPVEVTSQVPNIQQPDRQEFSSDRKVPSPPHLAFALSLVTRTALLSACLVVSSSFFTHPRKLWTTYEGLGNNRNSTIKSGNNLVHRPQLAQQTFYPARLVFDPGGSASVVALHKDVRKCKPKTRSASPSHATPTPSPTFHAAFSPLSVLKPRFFI